MRGDFPAFAIIPIVFLVLFVVTAILLIGWQQVTPIINASMNSVNAPAQYHNAYMNVGNNLYSFDTYLVMIFFFVELATLLSTVLLDVNPISWLVGILLLPFVYYIAAWESNIARAVALQPVLAAGVSHLPLSQLTLAHLDLITILFAAMYVVLLGVRLYFYSPSTGGRGGPSAPAQY